MNCNVLTVSLSNISKHLAKYSIQTQMIVLETAKYALELYGVS